VKGIRPEGMDEMLRLAASLERVSSSQKEELGALLLERLGSGTPGGLSAWCVGRLGARQPVAAHTAVGPEIAERWLEELLALDWGTVEGLPFAAMQVARKTGDRARDIDGSLAQTVAQKLEQSRAPAHWVKSVLEPSAMEGEEQARVFGESLPSGLRLID
jgi:hypothetical protein